MPGKSKRQPSRLFLRYALRLALRAVLFGIAVYLLVASPELLDPNEYFGFAHGITFIDVVFIFLLADIITKFFPNAKIAIGSRKQYRSMHLPTASTFRGGLEGIQEYLREMQSEGVAIASETAEGVRETARSIAQEATALRLLSFDPEDLSADEALRQDIRRSRLREIVPVIVFWILLNAVVAVVLIAFDALTPSVAVVWMLFYFLFDMICVVAWCPLQLLLMRNRCCTTCQIFNWDAMMTATPLIFAWGWFSGIILALSAIVLLRWELAFVRHPERFDERTNASLKCANCTDRLCHLRRPLNAKM